MTKLWSGWGIVNSRTDDRDHNVIRLQGRTNGYLRKCIVSESWQPQAPCTIDQLASRILSKGFERTVFEKRYIIYVMFCYVDPEPTNFLKTCYDNT